MRGLLERASERMLRINPIEFVEKGSGAETGDISPFASTCSARFTITNLHSRIYMKTRLAGRNKALLCEGGGFVLGQPLYLERDRAWSLQQPPLVDKSYISSRVVQSSSTNEATILRGVRNEAST